ncbi:MAG TPA: hypothetical protein VND21_06055, partial [Planctomycetota bacterium]|nr:hypothetical protein [Planctomycetota bacterium]
PALAAGPDAARRAEVLKIVDALRLDAARIRGLPWKQEVPADLISRQQLRINLEEMIKEEMKPEEYDRDLRMLRRLGLLREDEDPIQIQLTFLEQGIAGYFNPKTKRLYVIDGLTGDGQRPTILHELVHALEDQYIDLETSQKALEKDGDRLFAFKCVVEGSAEHARRQYEKENPEIARLSVREQRSSQSAGEMARILAAVPALLILPTLLQYQTGPAFVGRAVGEEYVKGMERLYGDAPLSQEQVLHPGKYLAPSRDLPRRMVWPADIATTLGEGWKGHEAMPMGQLDVALWLDRWFGRTNGKLDVRLMSQGRFWTQPTQVASQGWDGMWLQVFDKGDKTIGYAFASAWDSNDDAREAGEAIEAALRKQYGKGFASEGWKDGDGRPVAEGGDGERARPLTGDGGVRTIDFTGTYGPGRIEVRGDEVRAADGFPEGALDRVWTRVAAVKIERDAADTWTEAGEPDVLAGVDWRSERAGAGWKAPEGWKLMPQPDGSGFAEHGDTKVRISVLRGGVQENKLRIEVELKRRHPMADLDWSRAEDVELGTQAAGCIPMHDAGKTENPRNREIYVVPTEGALVLLDVEHPRASWDAARPQIDKFLGGFTFRN